MLPLVVLFAVLVFAAAASEPCVLEGVPLSTPVAIIDCATLQALHRLSEQAWPILAESTPPCSPNGHMYGLMSDTECLLPDESLARKNADRAQTRLRMTLDAAHSMQRQLGCEVGTYWLPNVSAVTCFNVRVRFVAYRDLRNTEWTALTDAIRDVQTLAALARGLE